MKKQYYTPRLKEFKTGFRYEHYIPSKEVWAKETFYLNEKHINIINYVDIQTENTLLKVRVRHLDHYDMIEAGWKENTATFSEGRLYYSLDNLECYLENEKLCIYPENSDNESYCFKGIVKNYNQLLDVMEMLGINKEK